MKRLILSVGCLLILSAFIYPEKIGGGGIPMVKGNLYIVSIGIDTYNDVTYKFCKTDVQKLSGFFTSQFKTSGIVNSREPFVRTFEDKQVTLANLDATMKEIAKTIKSEDYFIFSFAGSGVQMKDGDVNFYLNGASVTVTNKTGVEENPDNPHFNLLQLRTWLNLISAKNQLLISESGNGNEFAKNLQRVVVGTEPIETILSDRNRIILTTTTYGFEDESFGGGGLATFISSMKENNFFNLFDKVKRKKTEFELYRNEVENKAFQQYWALHGNRGLYTKIFYESELIENLQSFKSVLTESPATRGAGANVVDKKESGVMRDAVQNVALIIGINDYDAPTWKDLFNPIADAKAIEADLKNLYGFKTELLINPTKSEILQAIYKYSEMQYDSVKSQLLIFWAGHGGHDKFQGGYLVARDSKSLTEDKNLETYIDHSKIRTMLTNNNCPHVMLVLDACFGGTFDQKISNSSHRGPEDVYKQVIDESFLQRKLKNRTRLYITSGGKVYVPDGAPGNHSPFARQFLDLLRNAGGQDKILTFAEIKSGIERLTPEPCAGEFDGNEPGSDFLLISKN